MAAKKKATKAVKDLPAKAQTVKGGSGDPHLPTAVTPTVGGIINPGIRVGFPK